MYVPGSDARALRSARRVVRHRADRIVVASRERSRSPRRSQTQRCMPAVVPSVLRGSTQYAGISCFASSSSRRAPADRCSRSARTSAPSASRISSATVASPASRGSSRRSRRSADSRRAARRAGSACRSTCCAAVRSAGRRREQRVGHRRPRRWRSGVMSSMIQNPRPCVATIRSPSWTTMSRTERVRQVLLQRLPVVAVVERHPHAGLGRRRRADPCGSDPRAPH